MTRIIVEDKAYEGVKRIAKIFAYDYELVYGEALDIESNYDNNNCGKDVTNFVFMTLDSSDFIEQLSKKEELKIVGKRECYQIIKHGIDIYVVGSDKRGTIYGIFDLSEQIGVTPFVFWGDAKPAKRKSFHTSHIVEKISKQPSVEYRGFFINDEWPCFGNWTFSHYGGFTADMYVQVYELLLRLKGNCLWPAMWSSSFALDGPGNLNEELADIYGVVINYSHHEPCLRASEEWDIYKGEEGEYGTEWNYVTNKEGLHNYWRDGLIRSGRFENIITMGMRGERDSKMQGVSTLKECIDAWKEIIKNQDELINTYVEDSDTHPRMIAIYKEVEDYFFGDENTEGLAGWKGLDNKILMFCEDNYGYMRTLPQGDMQNHKGGLGMYFHLDYHGEPVSYEWINTTPLYKIWEQMSVAYNHGIHKMWMVNVGDLKGNEYPLSYFLAMAYDYDKWGDKNLDSFNEYAKYFARTVFANEEVSQVLTEGIDIISLRRPEALSIDTYSLMHGENDYVISKCQEILDKLHKVKMKLSDDVKDAYFSMIEYPIEIGVNHLLLHLYAKKNEHFAYQGKSIANHYADLVSACYQNEARLKSDFLSFKDGKWKGMELGSHTGFTKWNDFGRKNPIICRVELLPESHMLVSKVDEDCVYSKTYGEVERIYIDDYNYMGSNRAAVEISVDGPNALVCHVECNEKAVSFNWTEKEIQTQELLLISIDDEYVNDFNKPIEVKLTDDDTTVILELRKPKDYIVFNAVTNLAESRNCTILHGYGKHESAIRFNCNSSATYEFECMNDFEGEIELCFAPTNSNDFSKQLSLHVELNGDGKRTDILEDNYRAGDANCKQWSNGVLCNERRVTICGKFITRMNRLIVNGTTEGIILEKIIIHEKGIGSTYLGI